MASEYALVIKSRNGDAQRILTGQAGGFLQIAYDAEVNAPGQLTFDVVGGHEVIDLLEQDGQIEVWWRDPDLSVTWQQDFDALFVDEIRSADDDGNTIYRAICPGVLDFLGREVVLWYSNTADRSIFTSDPAETIMKTLVTYNATTTATTANGRVEHDSDLDMIAVESDGGGGTSITFACAWKNLLVALQEIARIGGRDFWLEKTAAQTWEFRTAEYLGADNRDSLIFALNYGNMARPVLRRNRLNEKTVAVVGGQGTEVDRDTVKRTGANYDADFNSRVIFYAATEYTTEAGLNAAGDIRLDELQARDDLNWDIIQTPGCLYRTHYALGDVVTGYYEGVTAAKQIRKVSVTFALSGNVAETIRMETANVNL